MRIDVVTIFPRLVEEFATWGLLGRARDRGLLDLRAHDLRRWSHDRHRSVDDAPYGGGAGMVMTPAPFFDAVADLSTDQSHVVLLSPRGRLLDQAGVGDLARRGHLILLCGRYEGVDERVSELADEEISIGDYVLAGGELPALVIVEAVARLIPGVLGNPESLATESHSSGLLEHPQYTRPAEYRGMRVPDVLLSGDHGAVARWRMREARRLTAERRPDLRDRGST
jgi:tRNA (guanine37-N1)-methyltransferase